LQFHLEATQYLKFTFKFQGLPQPRVCGGFSEKNLYIATYYFLGKGRGVEVNIILFLGGVQNVDGFFLGGYLITGIFMGLYKKKFYILVHFLLILHLGVFLGGKCKNFDILGSKLILCGEPRYRLLASSLWVPYCVSESFLISIYFSTK
jgi:hypothetical protein